MRTFLMNCRSRRNVRRATTTALIVGPLLVLINQTPVLARLLDGEIPPRIAVLRISLTFFVPFLVSLSSSALAGTPGEGKE
jgi:hypothetical protein